MDDYKYEVAISCTKEDESVAQELHGLLQPRVQSIFFYPENQKELIGQDGIQKFGSVFRTESRVVLVVYREKWGKTPWTQVEENAIKEMCLNGGWTRVILHSTDGTAPLWLPKFYIWSGSRYGLSALAAARGASRGGRRPSKGAANSPVFRGKGSTRGTSFHGRSGSYG